MSYPQDGIYTVTKIDAHPSSGIALMTLLDEEDDINKINDYFSYEHFYVIYCKFWELDTDHVSVDSVRMHVYVCVRMWKTTRT